jgi:hypothetical protein
MRGLSRRVLAVAAVVPGVATIAASSYGAATAQARQVSVCARGCAYRQPADAVAAAGDGDTVTVGPGVYAGGFAVDKSITLRGAGPALTTIRGGGPVVTLGADGAAAEPTITLRGLTITGGLTRSSMGQNDFALGGGVWIPPSADGGVGATVTIADSAITGNAAAPAASVDAGAGHPCSDTSDCLFAQAGGGGIDSWGDLTVERSVISDNTATSPATSDADGAGIYGQQGSLTVQDSVIARNQAIAGPAAGRYAEGAGIMFDTFSSGGCVAPAPACSVVVRGSTVIDNRSVLTTSLPAFAKGALIGTGVNAGGIHIGDGIATTVLNSNIVDNTATADNPSGEATAIDAAMLVGDSPLTMQNVRVSGNQTLNTVATSADIGPGGSTLELDGPGDLSNIALVHNASSETSVSGLASDAGALAVFNFTGDPEPVTVRDSVISGNVAEADSSTVQATVQGSGVFNNSLLTLDGVAVVGNVGRANGQGGLAQGGGIWNGVDLSGPPVQLTLSHSAVVHNALAAGPAIERQGGGLYTTSPVTLDHSVVALNQPDQCVGCSTTAQAMTRQALRRAPAISHPTLYRRVSR